MTQGRLHVTIVEAAKLIDKDKTDFNDPYVEIYVNEKEKRRTTTLTDVERPVWNETFDFDIWPSNDYLHVNVYDADEGKKPDVIGKTKVSLDDVIKKGHFDDWIKLPGLLGLSSRGDIHIRMTFEKS